MKLRWWNDVRTSLALDSQPLSDQGLVLGPRPIPIGVGTDEVWNGTNGNDTHAGTRHDDTLNGMGGNDIIDGRKGNDDITGGTGDDTLTGGKGNDTLDGGDGFDFAIYTAATTGVTVKLTTGVAKGEGKDTLIGIERVMGSVHDDTLKGDASDNRFDGGLGDDFIDGGDGINDVALYWNMPPGASGVTVDLEAGIAFSSQGADTLRNIEHVYGGGGPDTMWGDNSNNLFSGLDGDDHLFGSKGDDFLHAGNGADTLTAGRDLDFLYGGAGTDTFVFPEITGTATTHYMPDAVGGETVDFSAIDAIPGGGDQAFLVVEEFNGSKGLATVDYEAANNQTVIRLDVNGGASPQAELIVRITGNHITGSSPETYDLTIIW